MQTFLISPVLQNCLTHPRQRLAVGSAGEQYVGPDEDRRVLWRGRYHGGLWREEMRLLKQDLIKRSCLVVVLIRSTARLFQHPLSKIKVNPHKARSVPNRRAKFHDVGQVRKFRIAAVTVR